MCHRQTTWFRVLQCVAVCCSVLQYIDSQRVHDTTHSYVQHDFTKIIPVPVSGRQGNSKLNRCTDFMKIICIHTYTGAFSLSLSLSLSPVLSVCVSLSLYISFSFSISLSLSLYIFLSLSLSLSLIYTHTHIHVRRLAYPLVYRLQNAVDGPVDRPVDTQVDTQVDTPYTSCLSINTPCPVYPHPFPFFLFVRQAASR